jgi:thiol-disulfide isomerase/thioredoxin
MNYKYLSNHKVYLYIIAAIVFAFLTVPWTARANNKISGGNNNPQIIIIEKTFNLSDVAGRYVYLVFVSEYCRTCSETLINLNELYKKYKSTGVAVFAIYIDKYIDRKRLEKFASEKKIVYPLIIGNEEIVKGYDVHFVPTVLLVDKKGKVVKKYLGRQPLSAIEKDFILLKNRN